MRPTSVGHAGRDDHRPTAAVGGDRARIEHVAAVADAEVGIERPGILRHRHAFARQRRLVGVEIGLLDDAGVGRHPVTGLHQHDIAGHDLVGGDALALAIADHGRFGGGERHQRPHRALGPRLLEEAEQRVEHDDRQDDDGLVGQRGLARVLQQPLDHRDDRGHQQDDDEEILELLEQPLPPRCLRGALQPVRSVLLQTPLRLGPAQAACKVGAECRDHPFGRLSVRSGNTRDERSGASRIAFVLVLRSRLRRGLQHRGSYLRWKLPPAAAAAGNRRPANGWRREAEHGGLSAIGLLACQARRANPANRPTGADASSMATSDQGMASRAALPFSRATLGLRKANSAQVSWQRSRGNAFSALPARPEIRISC